MEGKKKTKNISTKFTVTGRIGDFRREIFNKLESTWKK